MSLVLPAMQDKLIRVAQSHLAQLTQDRLGWCVSLLRLVRGLARRATTPVWIPLECLYTLIIEFVLESEGASIARFEVLLPAFVDALREHQLHL